MKTRLLLLFVVFALGACNEDEILTPAMDFSGETHPNHEIYCEALLQYQTLTKSPGVILHIARKGEDSWTGAAGNNNMEKSIPLTIHTPVRIGSISKMYIAAYILMLNEQNLLSLESTLPELLPEIASNIPGSEKITVKHLLAHQAGIYDPSNNDFKYKLELINNPAKFGSQGTTALMEKYVFGKSLLFQPGTQYAYSNTGYWLLGLIIEKIKGKKKLDSILRDELFLPFGLLNTHLSIKDKKEAGNGYAIVLGRIVQDVTGYDSADGDGKPHGGIITTASDAGKFLGKLFDGQIISEESVNLMKKIQLNNCDSPDCEYGLGLEIWTSNGVTAYGHNGSSVGYEANLLYFENSKTVLFLFKNLGGGSDKNFLFELGK